MEPPHSQSRNTRKIQATCSAGSSGGRDWQDNNLPSPTYLNTRSSTATVRTQRVGNQEFRTRELPDGHLEKHVASALG
jgi:hypothetical protein